MSFRKWKQFAPFYFYGGLALCLASAAAFGPGPSRGQILILFVSGFLSWGLIEYCLHRFIFHYHAHTPKARKFVYEAHLSHHENPNATDRFFSSLRFSVPIAASYWLLLWAILGTWRAASYFSIGVIAGYFCYEWLHFQAHHRRPRLPLFRYLKKYHLLHHYRSSESRFGVTSPLFDLALGTFQPVREYRRAKTATKARAR